MAESVAMPKAGISVESCVMGAWQKQVGDWVSIGDVLFEYETDKAAFECESTAEGTLLARLYEAGDEVPVLQPVCVVGKLGEEVSAYLTHGAAPGAAEAEATQKPGAEPARVRLAAPPEQTDSVRPGAGISPRAGALAALLNLDERVLDGSGPHGRVIERDVQAAAAMPGCQAFLKTDEPAARAAVTSGAGFADEKMPRIRQSIARAMHASLQGAAQLTHHHSFDASAILTLREKIKRRDGAPGLSGVTLGDMVLYAAVHALKKSPYMNAHLLAGDVLRTFSGVHLGVAVDTDRGLMVPTVFDADKLSLCELSASVKELAELCRNGGISPDLLQGGTFTVSNLGSLGVESFTPILNPPQVGILGVCCVVERPRTGPDGRIELYKAMGLSLTYDHRAVDGAPAARFAGELARSLESFPLLLAL